MSDPNDNTSPYTLQGAVTIKALIPYLLALAAFGYAVWNSANNSTQLQATEAFQGQEIQLLVTDDKSAQALSYSISSQLAQLAQSVADIKAGMPHAGP